MYVMGLHIKSRMGVACYVYVVYYYWLFCSVHCGSEWVGVASVKICVQSLCSMDL